MDITRRDFLVLAATAPLLAHIPVPVEPAPPVDHYALDELPLSGFAGECSGRH